MHDFKRREHIAPALEYRQKAPVVVGVRAEGVVYKLAGVFKLNFEGVARRAAVRLAILEQSKYPRRLSLEYAFAHGAYFAAVRAKTVHSVLAVAGHARPKLPHRRENVFWQLYAHSLAGGLCEGVDYAEGFVNGPHESLHFFLLASANKSEALGHGRLLFKIENVSRAVRLKMQVVSHS